MMTCHTESASRARFPTSLCLANVSSPTPPLPCGPLPTRRYFLWVVQAWWSATIATIPSRGQTSRNTKKRANGTLSAARCAGKLSFCATWRYVCVSIAHALPDPRACTKSSQVHAISDLEAHHDLRLLPWCAVCDCPNYCRCTKRSASKRTTALATSAASC